jgi:ABC-type glycerol-3-phosphate transport system permease component
MRLVRAVGFALGVILLLVFFLLPFVWLISTSFKTYLDAFAIPPVVFFTPVLVNYARILANADFISAFFNSAVVSLSASAIAVLIGALAAYGLVYGRLRKVADVELFILSLRIAPPILFVIPTYYLANHFGVLDSYGLLIGVYTVVNVPFGISLLITYFRDVPPDMREAALVDGCNEWQAFWRIVVPVVRGGLTATMILSVLFTWNEFLIALVLTGKTTQTLPVAITAFLTFQGTEWGPLTAAGTLIMLPMVAVGLMAQRNLVRGITIGSVK